MNKKRNKNKQSNKDCLCCDCCVPIGEGDHICDKGVPFCVLDEYCPTEYYAACNNPKTFQEAQQNTISANMEN